MSEENRLIIREINMFVKVRETWELLDEIERLNKELESKNKVIDAMIDNEEEYCIEINNLKERIAYLERSNDRREEEIISLRDELVGEDK